MDDIKSQIIALNKEISNDFESIIYNKKQISDILDNFNINKAKLGSDDEYGYGMCV